MKQLNIFNEIIVDNFAGGGGASTGIELAIGHSVEIAINHDPAAIAMHKVNHPTTEHYQESVWDIDPIKVVRGRRVALCWFSPDCKHFSKAKGKKPVEKNIRGLAWVAVKWAVAVKPRVIMLENVEEFKTWGPLDEKGYPIENRKGETFKALIACLSTGLKDEEHPAWPEIQESLGEYYSKEDLVRGLGYEVEYKELVACDYGAPTTRKRFFLIARLDGKPIVWPTPTHGNPKSEDVKNEKLKPWRTAAEIIDWSIPCPSIFERNKDLVGNTLSRIARGMQKFVFSNPQPFIARIGQTGFGGDKLQYSLDQPLTTIVSKAEHLLVTPFLTSYHSETQPGEVRGLSLENPIHTLDTSNRFGLVTPFISKYYGGFYEGAGSDIADPVDTITTKERHAVVTPFITKYYGADIGQDINGPLHTVTTKDRFGMVTLKVTKIDNTKNLGHWNLVRDLLNQYCNYNIPADEILLLCINKNYYFISDIGMRMLAPPELFKAQGFPEDYIIDHDCTGKPYPKTAQVARCGNAVPPPFAEALVRANLPELCEGNGRFREVV